MRGLDAAAQGAAVALGGHAHDARAVFFRELDGAVGGAVVGDEHLAGDAREFDAAPRLLDTGDEGFGLVEAGHDDGEVAVHWRDVVAPAGWSTRPECCFRRPAGNISMEFDAREVIRRSEGWWVFHTLNGVRGGSPRTALGSSAPPGIGDLRATLKVSGRRRTPRGGSWPRRNRRSRRRRASQRRSSRSGSSSHPHPRG